MIKPKERNEWLENLISTDFFRIRKDPDILETMITPQRADLGTINYAILSMVSSTPHGANYLAKHDSFLDRTLKMFKDSENGTVLQRFSLAVVQKMSILEKASKFYLENKFLYWIVDFLEEMDTKTTHSFIPIYLMSAFYNIISAEVNEKEIEDDIYKNGKLLKRLLSMFKRSLPGAFYIAVLEVIKHFQKHSGKWKELELEGKITDTLNAYLADVDGTFKEANLLDKLKDDIIDTMKLLAGDEKPIGYYVKKKENEDDDVKDKDKEKAKKGKKKKKKKSSKDEKGKSSDWRYEDIKLYRGELKYLGDAGFEGMSKKVEFEVFKDELDI